MEKQFSMSMYANRDDMYKAMMEYIRELEGRNQWVSVKERLPESGKECRVYLGGYEQEPFYKFDAITHKWLVQGDNGVWNQSGLIHAITHYYYCPLPPEEEK